MKKDPDYVAAVEKAISEKYGKKTAHNIKSNWTPEKEKEYLEQLKEAARLNKGRKQRTTASTSRSCPVCKTYSFSSRDDLYMLRFSTCYSCYVDFVSPDIYKWQQGKRPDKKYVEEILRRRKNGNRPRDN